MPSSRMYAHPDSDRSSNAGARASWARTWQSTLSQLDKFRLTSDGSCAKAMLPACHLSIGWHAEPNRASFLHEMWLLQHVSPLFISSIPGA